MQCGSVLVYLRDRASPSYTSKALQGGHTTTRKAYSSLCHTTCSSHSTTMRSALFVLMAAAGISAVVEAAAVVETATPPPIAVSEQTQALLNSPELTRMIRKGKRAMHGRSFFQTMSSNIMNYLGYGDSEEYEEYSEDPDYFYPNFDTTALLGGNSAGGGAGSSYSFYNPYGNYHPARDDNFEEEEEYGWGDFMFDAAIVAVPMALVLAAMPTGLFTIPVVGRTISNNIEETLKPFEIPVLRAVEKADFLSFTTRDCQERIFCELTQVGRHPEASMLQKIMYLAANLTPNQYAESYGLSKLMKASRDGHCQVYKCVPLMTASTATKAAKKEAAKSIERKTEHDGED